MIKTTKILLLLLLTTCFLGCSVSRISTSNHLINDTPGGNQYLYSGMAKIKFSSNGINCYIFQPLTPPNKSLPLISFQHGYDLLGNQSKLNVGLINHLVKKGYIIFYNEFQPYPWTNPKRYESNAAVNIKNCISYIAAHPNKCVQIATHLDGSIKFGLIGYSVGGVTSVNLASNYVNNSIPKPSFIFTMEANNGGGKVTPTRDASTVPTDTFVAMVMAEDDDIKTFTTSSNYWNQMKHIPESRKQWIGIYSDINIALKEKVIADHHSPISNRPDVLDYYGFYKWATAIANYSFYGKDLNYWWGNATEQTFMGTWNDGKPIRPAKGSQEAFWPGHSQKP